MSLMADLLGTLFERRYSGAPVRDNRPLEPMLDDLLSRSGEMSGVTLGRQILDRYAEMDEEEKRGVFRILLDRMDIDADRVQSALEAYRATPDKASYRAFATASEPKRQEVARRLNQVPGATARLVGMRADLLRFLRDAPDLAPVDEDLRHLFRSWFNRGFLVLRPVTWQSPANILEKIIEYEAVHAIDSWDDLRNRLEPVDRRCFAFFHPAMPDEPLIFVEVALTAGIPGSVQNLLATGRKPLSPAKADTAVFYSISNCQAGLAGISFGNSLIKQVVEVLSRDMPHLAHFVTLSPIPGFGKWLTSEGLEAAADVPETRRALAADYLLHAKTGDGKPLDPVARFHLYNGALVHEIHAEGDLSAKGLAQSGGAMVNYLYDLARITENHEQFAGAGKVVASRGAAAAARKGAAIERLKRQDDE